jgi:hypothetical protein
MPFPLALHCWLFAPDGDTHNQLDDVCEITESYNGFGIGFYGFQYMPYLASIGPDRILEKSLYIMKCVQDWEQVLCNATCADPQQRFYDPIALRMQSQTNGYNLANPSDHDSFKCVINDSGNAFLK